MEIVSSTVSPMWGNYMLYRCIYVCIFVSNLHNFFGFKDFLCKIGTLVPYSSGYSVFPQIPDTVRLAPIYIVLRHDDRFGSQTEDPNSGSGSTYSLQETGQELHIFKIHSAFGSSSYIKLNDSDFKFGRRENISKCDFIDYCVAFKKQPRNEFKSILGSHKTREQIKKGNNTFPI